MSKDKVILISFPRPPRPRGTGEREREGERKACCAVLDFSKIDANKESTKQQIRIVVACRSIREGGRRCTYVL